MGWSETMSSHRHHHRSYVVALCLRILLALTPLSILHPDEWMQSVESSVGRAASGVWQPQRSSPDGAWSSSTDLEPTIRAATWDGRFTCFNATHPPHVPTVIQTVRDWDGWERAMRSRSGVTIDTGSSDPATFMMRCPRSNDGNSTSMKIQAPIRGTLFPWLCCAMPHQLYHVASRLITAAGSHQAAQLHHEASVATPWMLFIFPRTVMLLGTIITDLCLFFLSSRWLPKVDPWSIVASFGWSVCQLVFLSRTFSNGMETMLVALAMAWAAWGTSTFVAGGQHRAKHVRPPTAQQTGSDQTNVVRPKQIQSIQVEPRSTLNPSTSSPSSSSNAVQNTPSASRSRLQMACLFFGLIVGLGFCVRVSCVFWTWPLGLLLIQAMYESSARETRSALPTKRGKLLHNRTARWISCAIHTGILVAIPCMLVILLCTIFDSLHYETLWLCDIDPDGDDDIIIGAVTDPHKQCVSGVVQSMQMLLQCILQWRLPMLKGTLLFTPLRNYLYNSVATNVAAHGLHPRYLHLTINATLLFGPVAYWRLVRTSWNVIQRAAVSHLDSHPNIATLDVPSTTTPTHLRQNVDGTERKDGAEHDTAPENSGMRRRRQHSQRKQALTTDVEAVTQQSSSAFQLSRPTASCFPSHSSIHFLLVVQVWSGILFLSIVPHQEIRFLLPACIPLALLLAGADTDNLMSADAMEKGASHAHSSSRSKAIDHPVTSRRGPSMILLRSIEIIHLLVAIILLGILHQGGQLRLLMDPMTVHGSCNIGTHTSTPASMPTSTLHPPPTSDGTLSTSHPIVLHAFMHLYTTPMSFLRASARMYERRTGKSCQNVMHIYDQNQAGKEIAERIDHLAADGVPLNVGASPSASSSGSVHLRLHMPGSLPFPLQQLQHAHRLIRPDLIRMESHDNDDGDDKPPLPISSTVPTTTPVITNESTDEREVCHTLQRLCSPSCASPSSASPASTATNDIGCAERCSSLLQCTLHSHSIRTFPHLTLDDAPQLSLCGPAEAPMECLKRQLSIITYDIRLE